ncbi:phosphoribosyltransferase [Amycolatopsis azurea]|uniref:Phosphoribosyltransferase domain-containing protein n=1 Tax=Amycolatopsis azurea DSM 43854 TaxID=1238180 RepID=A0ABX3JKG1_9PSEU|nr:phosphoribosyltransferase family protein [Amycolatopsis azurea]OOC08160.1 hypothetical protein B0293_04645 [Amycolatopsis azurea DSM 43854]
MRRILSWSDIERCVDNLVAALVANEAPEVLIAIARGGMVPAALLSHRLGVRDVRILQAQVTRGDSIDADRLSRVVVPDAGQPGDLTGKSVLVVDDITTTGETLMAVVDVVRAQGCSMVNAAVCVVRPDFELEIEFDLVAGCSLDGWIVFPWELGTDKSH